jgi:hypothetical protein
VIPVLGATKYKSQSDNYFLVKVEENGKVIEPKSALSMMNSFADSTMNGLWIAGKTDWYKNLTPEKRAEFLDKSAKAMNAKYGQ